MSKQASLFSFFKKPVGGPAVAPPAAKPKPVPEVTKKPISSFIPVKQSIPMVVETKNDSAEKSSLPESSK